MLFPRKDTVVNIEQKINYELNKYPFCKKIVKRVYQRGMYIISPKIKAEGDIIKISPNDNDHEYFFGYYDKSPWDISDRYILCMKANDTWSDVSPRETADILLIDTEAAESNPKRVKKIAETKAWNVQQGCMLQWLGPNYCDKILYNDFQNGQYCSVVLNLASKKKIIINAPVYTVSEDGSIALTLDFSRLYSLRPGYGYYNKPDYTKNVALPDGPCIWKIFFKTGEIKPLLSYSDFVQFQPRAEMLATDAVHKVNHLMLSPNGKRFAVLYRWFNGKRKYTRLITCNIDGTDMYLLSDDDMVSHYFWKDNDYIIAFENKNKQGTGYYLMKDKTRKYVRCWPQFCSDGHPSYSPNGKFIVTDTYPDRARISRIYLMDSDEQKKDSITLVKVFSPFKYDNDSRCDLHPRWNHKGNQICFDSVFEGHRGLYCVKIPTENNLKKKPLISVIVPIYKAERYLSRCIQSIIGQTYGNIEIILVDDGSPDHCPTLCDQYAQNYKNIRVIHKPNGGSGSARNAGIEIANGDFIAFVDSDDWIVKDMYEYMMKLIHKYNADIADIKVVQVFDKRKKVKVQNEKISVYKENEILEHYLYRGLCEKNGAPYSICRKLIKKELFENASSFIEGIVNEDICFNYKLLQNCHKIVVSNQIKYYYFQRNESISNGKCKKRDLDLLVVSDELVQLAKESKDTGILRLAKMKQARSFFSILARITIFGTDESIEHPQTLVRQLCGRLRKNIFLILRSPMPLSRKIVSVAFSINYKITSKLMKKIIITISKLTIGTTKM